MPKYGEWWGDNLTEKAVERVTKNYSLEELSDKSFLSKLSNDEIRDVATFVYYISYSNAISYKIDINKYGELKRKINDEFNRRIDKILIFYNMLDHKHNVDKWNGDVRYKTLIWSNNKGDMEMSILKTAVWLYQLIGEETTYSLIETIRSACDKPLFWGFGFECSHKMNCDESPKVWKKVNEGRKKEIEAQNKFINYILDGEFDKAYNEFIEDEVTKRF